MTLKNDTDQSAFKYKNYDYLDSFEGLPALAPTKINKLSISYIRSILPGFACAAMISLSAMFLAEHYLAPAVFFALLLGLAVNFLSTIETTRIGLDFAAKDLLRIGIAISGAQITFQEISALGLDVVIAVIIIVAITFFSGVGISRLLKLPKELGFLSGGAVAICGASAALAVSSVLPASKHLERNTIFIIVCVATFSTIAMIAYPIISDLMGHSEFEAGIFFGASIHDVAQVLGAGYAVSDTSGEVATITKLLRVALLFPIVALIAIFIGARTGLSSTPKVPGFLIGFLVVVALNSFQLIPEELSKLMSQGARMFLIFAVAALGVKTSFNSLREVGWRPILMVFAQTALMAGLALSFIALR
ncbi:putative sulfate exporter family transporter [Alphaproteobacteria bacterium]|nr:putative sulfate exporter family transporter [Alphaproteobacteria bacterium]